jgi:hypothetical protein
MAVPGNFAPPLNLASSSSWPWLLFSSSSCFFEVFAVWLKGLGHEIEFNGFIKLSKEKPLLVAKLFTRDIDKLSL